jgi:tetratricopeptide (TPR) repeat protein
MNTENSQLRELERQAEALREAGNPSEAIAKLTELLAIDESFVRAHLALAVLYHQVQDYERAVAHAERAVELEPDDTFNHAALSITYQRAFAGTHDHSYIEKAERARDRGHMFG